jgi:hypothetical protein
MSEANGDAPKPRDLFRALEEAGVPKPDIRFRDKDLTVRVRERRGNDGETVRDYYVNWPELKRQLRWPFAAMLIIMAVSLSDNLQWLGKVFAFVKPYLGKGIEVARLMVLDRYQALQPLIEKIVAIFAS